MLRFHEQSPFGKELIIHNLRKLTTNSFYDICIVDKLADFMGIPAKQNPSYLALYTSHCLLWKDMTPYFRDELLKRTLWVLEIAPDEEEVKHLMMLGLEKL